jgi:hypothetical protein
MQNNIRDYLLGHQECELERLMQRAQAFGDISDHLLQLAGLTRGMRVLQEFDIELAGTLPRCELFEKTVANVKAAFTHRKLDLRFGRSLSQIFRAAGLPAPEMRMEGRVESGATALSCDAIAQVTRTLLPVMIQAEIATAEEIDIDTLATRLRDASLAYVPLIAAWSRVAAT